VMRAGGEGRPRVAEEEGAAGDARRRRGRGRRALEEGAAGDARWRRGPRATAGWRRVTPPGWEEVGTAGIGGGGRRRDWWR
jgi:hypothetical protein